MKIDEKIIQLEKQYKEGFLKFKQLEKSLFQIQGAISILEKLKEEEKKSS